MVLVVIRLLQDIGVVIKARQNILVDMYQDRVEFLFEVEVNHSISSISMCHFLGKMK